MFFVKWFVGVLYRGMIFSISFILPLFKICKLMPRGLYLNWLLLLFLVEISKFPIPFLLIIELFILHLLWLL